MWWKQMSPCFFYPHLDGKRDEAVIWVCKRESRLKRTARLLESFIRHALCSPKRVGNLFWLRERLTTFFQNNFTPLKSMNQCLNASLSLTPMEEDWCLHEMQYWHRTTKGQQYQCIKDGYHTFASPLQFHSTFERMTNGNLIQPMSPHDYSLPYRGGGICR